MSFIIICPSFFLSNCLSDQRYIFFSVSGCFSWLYGINACAWGLATQKFHLVSQQSVQDQCNQVGWVNEIENDFGLKPYLFKKHTVESQTVDQLLLQKPTIFQKNHNNKKTFGKPNFISKIATKEVAHLFKNISAVFLLVSPGWQWCGVKNTAD